MRIPPNPGLLGLAAIATLLSQPAPAKTTAGEALAQAAAPFLTKSAIRATNPALSDQAFALKWTASLASPLLFIRSYPSAYHHSLAAAAQPFGAESLCVGDAHPANFGWLRLGGKTRFAFNDLDDGGPCPVAFDALRYFVALKLLTKDDGLVKDIVERYVDVVKDPSRASSPPKSAQPDWGKVAAKALAESTKGDKLVGDALSAPLPADHDAVLAAVGKHPRLKGIKVIDLAQVERDHGGSGGLERFWVLADLGGHRTILELKEGTRPGVEWGRHTRTLPAGSRLETLERAFWGKATPDDWFTLPVGKRDFLVRDRTAKKSLDVESLGGKDAKDTLQAQASELGRIHARAWSGVKKDDLRAWLLDATGPMTKVWKEAYQAAKR